NDEIVALEAVTAVALLHLGLDLAVFEACGERGRLEHLAHEVRNLLRIVGARLGEERAPLRDDVSGGATADDADIRRRLLVDTSELEVGDGLRGRGDCRATLLRVHARMCRATVEADLQRVRVGSAEDDLADRSRLVVDVAHPSPELFLVERSGAVQPYLFLGREEELDPSVR